MPSEFFKSIPLQLEGTDGNFKQISNSAEVPLAHYAGESIVEAYDSVGSRYWGNLTSTADSSTDSVGSYTDTFYNEPIGTHPASSLSLGSTTAKLHIMQDSTNAAPANVFVAIDSAGDVYEMDSASVIKLGKRLAKDLMGDEGNGTFRLGSSLPSADHIVWDAAVFSDTLTNGSVDYNIYRKEFGSFSTSGLSNTLRLRSVDSANLQECTTEEMKVIARDTLLAGMEASGIGSYQLRSSAEGAPTDPGTWVARGTALDTRNTTQNIQYTSALFTSPPYSSNFSQQFSGQYTGVSFADVPTQFAGVRQVNFSGSRNYSAAYGGSRNYAVTSGPDGYSGQRSYAADYAGTRPAQYTGTRDFAGSRNYAANYAGVRINPQPANFTGPVQFSGPQPTNFVGPQAFNFSTTTQFSNNNPANFAGSTPANFAGTRPAQYAGVRQVNFAGTRAGSPVPVQFAGTRTIPGKFGPITYPDQFAGVQPGSPTPGNFAGPQPNNFAGSTPGNFAGTTPANFAGTRPANYLGIRNFIGVRQINFLGTRTVNFAGTRQYSGIRSAFFSDDYAGGRNYAGNYTSAPAQFLGTNPGQFAGSRAYADFFAGSRNYAGNYSGDRNYADNYLGPQAAQFTGFVPTQFSAQYTGQYTGFFAGFFTSQFSTQYTGETLVALSTTVETYTLYCKTAE